MDKFEKSLNIKILNQFSNAKEWSNLMSCIKEFKSLLKKKENSKLNFSLLKEKVILSKRLAQCLNPSLPHALHKETLDIYFIILENIHKENSYFFGEDLCLYSSGLFPFFQNATISNKEFFLDNLVKKIYILLHKSELQLCLPGLIVSILPGLSESNDDIKKRIKDIFKIIRQKLSDRIFFGTLWSIILKNHRLHRPGIEYLNEVIPPFGEFVNFDKENLNKTINDFYPNLNTLVINALSVVFESDDILTQRLGMDFLINKLPITQKNIIIDQMQKIKILIKALSLVKKNENSLNRRLIQYIFANEKREYALDPNDPETENKLVILILAIKIILVDTNEFTQQKSLDNLNIIEFILLQENVELIPGIYESLFLDLLSFIVKYWIINLDQNGESHNDKVIDKTKGIFKIKPPFIEYLWGGLAKKIESFCKKEINYNKIEKFFQKLKFCLIYLNIESNAAKVKLYIPIITNILNLINKISSVKESRNLIILCLASTKILQESNNSGTFNVFRVILSNVEYIIENRIDNLKDFVSEKFTYSRESLNENLIKQNLSILQSLSNSIIEYQKFYLNLIDSFLNLDQYSPISIGQINLFRHSTELIIRLQEYAQQKEVPEWIHKLQLLAFMGITVFSLSASNFLMDLILLNKEGTIYELISKFLLYEEINAKSIDEKYLNNLPHFSLSGKTCAEIMMANLWLQLEKQQYQKDVIDLLMKFSKVCPDKFINAILYSLEIPEIDIRIISLQKFSQYYKLANKFYPDEFTMNKKCLYRMLEFLEHDHPLIRHLSKSWLYQSMQQFEKILNPLIEDLITEAITWRFDNNKLLLKNGYTKEQSSRLVNIFKKLKDVVINSSSVDIKMFLEKSPNEELIKKDIVGDTLEKFDQFYVKRTNYLFWLISISIRYIGAKFINQTTISFSRDDYAVNAASCEFLEFLLSAIEPIQIIKVANKIIKPILKILSDAIDSNDEEMQVQILDLLGILLFINTKEIHPLNLKEAQILYGNKLLHICLIKGIQNNHFFVREHFLSFIESCLPIFSSVLPQEEITQIAYNLLITTCQGLVQKVQYSKGLEEKEANKFSHLNKHLNPLIYKNYLEEYSEYKTFEENDSYLIMRGLKTIFLHFLGVTKMVKTGSIKWEELKKSLIKKIKENGDFSLVLKDVMFSQEKKEEDENKIYYDNLILDIIFSAFISVWITDSEASAPYDYCINDKGTLEYKSDEGNVNESLLDISKISQIKQIITEICTNIVAVNPVVMITEILRLWNNQSLTDKDSPLRTEILKKDLQYKLTLIEILQSVKIPFHILLIAIKKYVLDLPKFKYVKGKAKYYICDYSQCVLESSLCHFLYSYILSYTFTSEDQISDIWSEFITIVNYISENSKITHTYCWLFELMNIMLTKLPFKDKAATSDIKKEVAEVTNTLYKKMTEITFENKFDSGFETANKIITPLIPSIYTAITKEIFPEVDFYSKGKEVKEIETKKKKTSRKKRKNDNTMQKNDIQKGELNKFYLSYYEKVIDQSVILSPEQSIDFYRKVTFVTLMNNYPNIIMSLYNQDGSKERNKYCSNILDYLFGKIKSDDKTTDSNFNFEVATEFLEHLMVNLPLSTSLTGNKQIMEYYLGETFFMTTQKMIGFWKKILQNFALNYNGDIMEDLLNHIKKGSLFSKGSDSAKSRTLRRISFVIYSCPNDTFEKNLTVLKEKVKKLLTIYNETPILESEIFLMMRVLFLRFSHNHIMEMIKILWPIIFSELILILTSKKKNCNDTLKLEALKFVELLSLANIEEFSLYQWIFIVDTFDMKQLESQNSESLIYLLLTKGTTMFKPITMNIIKNYDMINSFDEIKSTLLIVEKDYKRLNEEKLSDLTRKFFFSVGDMNNFKLEVNNMQIEEVMENDFLNKNEEHSK